MKKKKYKIIRNNRYIYAVKELGNKGIGIIRLKDY